MSQSTASGREQAGKGQRTRHLSVVSCVVLLHKYSTPFSPAATQEKAGRKGTLCLNDNLPMKGSGVSWAFIWGVGRGRYLLFALHFMVLTW